MLGNSRDSEPVRRKFQFVTKIICRSVHQNIFGEFVSTLGRVSRKFSFPTYRSQRISEQLFRDLKPTKLPRRDMLLWYHICKYSYKMSFTGSPLSLNVQFASAAFCTRQRRWGWKLVGKVLIWRLLIKKLIKYMNMDECF